MATNSEDTLSSEVPQKRKNLQWKVIREWSGTVFGLIGTILALVSFMQATEAKHQASVTKHVADQIKIDQTLAEAWDRLGGRPGTTVIFKFSEDPADLEFARRNIEEVLTKAPKNAKAQRYLAVYYEAVERFSEAQQAYEKAIELDPKSPAAHINYGIALTDTGDFNKAFDFFRRANELGGNATITLVNTGILLLEQGRKEEAERAFEEVKRQLQSQSLGLTKFDVARMRAMLEKRDFENLRPRYRPRMRRGR